MLYVPVLFHEYIGTILSCDLPKLSLRFTNDSVLLVELLDCAGTGLPITMADALLLKRTFID